MPIRAGRTGATGSARDGQSSQQLRTSCTIAFIMNHVMPLVIELCCDPRQKIIKEIQNIQQDLFNGLRWQPGVHKISLFDDILPRHVSGGGGPNPPKRMTSVLWRTGMTSDGQDCTAQTAWAGRLGACRGFLAGVLKVAFDSAMRFPFTVIRTLALPWLRRLRWRPVSLEPRGRFHRGASEAPE